jgi:hypothetical protein
MGHLINKTVFTYVLEVNEIIGVIFEDEEIELASNVVHFLLLFIRHYMSAGVVGGGSQVHQLCHKREHNKNHKKMGAAVCNTFGNWRFLDLADQSAVSLSLISFVLKPRLPKDADTRFAWNGLT